MSKPRRNRRVDVDSRSFRCLASHSIYIASYIPIQEQLESDLRPYLASASSDTAAMRTLKERVLVIIKRNAQRQLVAQQSLFNKEMNEIKLEHERQIRAVEYVVFSLFCFH